MRERRRGASRDVTWRRVASRHAASFGAAVAASRTPRACFSPDASSDAHLQRGVVHSTRHGEAETKCCWIQQHREAFVFAEEDHEHIKVKFREQNVMQNSPATTLMAA